MIRGQDAAWMPLEAAWKNGRLAHGYLFVGPVGVGKGTAARLFAQGLLCETQRESLIPCGICPGCKMFTAGSHPDFFALDRDAESTLLSVDDLRKFTEGLYLKPARGSRKVGLAEDAETMSNAASNAFLKTLEEPPPGCVLILVADGRAESLLATIVSRCRVVRFSKLSHEAIDAILEENGVQDRTRLTRLADGSAGWALALAEPALTQYREQLLDQLSVTPLPSVMLAARTVEFVQEAGKESAVQRRRAAVVLRVLLEAYRSALHHAIARPDPQATERERRANQALAERHGIEGLTTALERILESQDHLRRMIGVPLVLEATFDALAAGGNS